MARTKQTAKAHWINRNPVNTTQMSSTASNDYNAPPSSNINAPSNTSQNTIDPTLNVPPNLQNNVTKQQQKNDQKMTAGTGLEHFSIKFDDQDQSQKRCESLLALFRCKICEAILTAQSRILIPDSYNQLLQNTKDDATKQRFINGVNQNVWICQFCGNHNVVPKESVISKEQNPCFLTKEMKKEQKVTKKTILLCVDISSSMTQTIGKGKNRLQAIKQSLINEVSRMRVEEQQVNICLISFGNLVKIHQLPTTQNQKHKSIIIPQKTYDSFDFVIQQTNNRLSEVKIYDVLTQTNQIIKMIQDLFSHGSTALGPALITGITLLSTFGRGNQLILCTDGQANVGIGSARYYSPKAKQQQQFYTKCANYAQQKQVRVSILSLQGDSCNLKALSKLSLSSGGSLLKISPETLGTQFHKIIAEQVLGTRAKLLLRSNKLLRLVPNAQCKGQGQCKYGTYLILNQNIGSFDKYSQFTFEYLEIPMEDKYLQQLSLQPRLPFQIQLTYTSSTGNQYLQIITDWRILVTDQQKLFQEVNYGLFGASCLQKASKQIKTGNLNGAQQVIDRFNKLNAQRFNAIQVEPKLKQKFTKDFQKLEQVLISKRNKLQAKKSAPERRNRHMRNDNHRKLKRKTSAMKPSDDSSSSSPNGSKRSVNSSSGSISSANSAQKGGKIWGQAYHDALSSDSEQQNLVRCMRARSVLRSRSRSKSP